MHSSSLVKNISITKVVSLFLDSECLSIMGIEKQAFFEDIEL